MQEFGENYGNNAIAFLARHLYLSCGKLVVELVLTEIEMCVVGSGHGSRTTIYHEQQRLMHCAVHTLNALLQENAFTATSLTEIALSIGGKMELSHRWPILGNFDVVRGINSNHCEPHLVSIHRGWFAAQNVLLLALQQRGLEARWWDRRCAPMQSIAATVASPQLL